MNQCLCGNLLRSGQERQEGRCLECRIDAALGRITQIRRRCRKQRQPRPLTRTEWLQMAALLATPVCMAFVCWRLSVIAMAFERYLAFHPHARHLMAFIVYRVFHVWPWPLNA
jgi:hypothetical protein